MVSEKLILGEQMTPPTWWENGQLEEFSQGTWLADLRSEPLCIA